MNDEVPAYARPVAMGMTAAAALGLLANHFMADSQNSVSLMILALAPIALLLGIGGIVEPKVIWSLGKYGTHLPFKYKLVGGVLGVLGLVVSLVLVFFVYPFGN